MGRSDARLGSTCTGYGGLDLAVASVLDVEHAWVSDVCKFDKDGNATHHDPCRAPCSIFSRTASPGVPNLGDMKAIDCGRRPGPIDVFTAGVPLPALLYSAREATWNQRPPTPLAFHP